MSDAHQFDRWLADRLEPFEVLMVGAFGGFLLVVTLDYLTGEGTLATLAASAAIAIVIVGVMFWTSENDWSYGEADTTGASEITPQYTGEVVGAVLKTLCTDADIVADRESIIDGLDSVFTDEVLEAAVEEAGWDEGVLPWRS